MESKKKDLQHKYSMSNNSNSYKNLDSPVKKRKNIEERKNL